MRDEHIPADVAWRLSFLALDNAKRLHAAAQALVERGHFGPARSLAISVREEAGKFLKALLIGLEHQPGTDASKSLRRHEYKQALGVVLARLPSLVDFETFNLDLSKVSSDSLDEVLDHACEQLMAVASELTLNEEAVKELEAEVKSAAAGAHEMRRRRGLYVDAEMTDGQWTIHSPAEITEDEARAEVGGAEALLRILTGLESSLQLPVSLENGTLPDQDSLRRSLGRAAKKVLGGE
jgi:AbiV family abortive infection protein